ncbi:hypothetical protein ABIF24_008704 [Bradyrhizobium elkanii]
MLRRVAICLAFAVLALGLAGAASARQRHQTNPVPFAHTPCSVLDSGPCIPSYCSVFNHGPCLPEIDYPYGENLQLTILTVPPQDQAEKYRKPDHDLNTIGDLFAALRACWAPPPPDDARAGMQMSVRFSFKRSGEMIGAPRLTFFDAGHPGRHPHHLPQCDQRLAGCLPAPEIHRRIGRRAGRPADHDPLCRQPGAGQIGQQAVKLTHCHPPGEGDTRRH